MKKITDIAKTTKVQWESLAGPIDDNFDELNNGKLSKAELAQTTGNSKTTAMSQDAVTKELTELNNKASSVGYVTCDTAAATAAKTITVIGMTALSTGIRLLVKMSNNNTAANATMNINSLGAKPLYYNNERVSGDNAWEAGEVIEVYYDGNDFYSSNVLGGVGSGGNMILAWNTDTSTTRKQVKLSNRKPGMQISYKHPDMGWINEQYVGEQTIDLYWQKDENWSNLKRLQIGACVINRTNYYLNQQASNPKVGDVKGDFTINFMCLYYSKSTGTKILGKGSAWNFHIGEKDNIAFTMGSKTVESPYLNSLTLNTITRNGSTVSYFQNGQLIESWDDSSDYVAEEPISTASGAGVASVGIVLLEMLSSSTSKEEHIRCYNDYIYGNFYAKKICNFRISPLSYRKGNYYGEGDCDFTAVGSSTSFNSTELLINAGDYNEKNVGTYQKYSNISNDGSVQNVIEPQKCHVTPYIDVTNIDSFDIINANTNSLARYAFYDKDKKFISANNPKTVNEYNIEKVEGAYFARFTMKADTYLVFHKSENNGFMQDIFAENKAMKEQISAQDIAIQGLNATIKDLDYQIQNADLSTKPMLFDMADLISSYKVPLSIHIFDVVEAGNNYVKLSEEDAANFDIDMLIAMKLSDGKYKVTKCFKADAEHKLIRDDAYDSETDMSLVVQVQSLHDTPRGGQGQHLSAYGYRAYAHYVAEQFKKRTTYRYNNYVAGIISLNCDQGSGSPSTGITVKGEKVCTPIEQDYVRGGLIEGVPISPTGGISNLSTNATATGQTITYVSIQAKEGSSVEFPFDLPLNSDYFVEVIACNPGELTVQDVVYETGEVTLQIFTDGEEKMSIKLDKNVKRYILSGETFKKVSVKFTNNLNGKKFCLFHLLSIAIYKLDNRIKTPIINSTTKIAVLGNSWTEFPVKDLTDVGAIQQGIPENDPDMTPAFRPDGSGLTGLSFFPRELARCTGAEVDCWGKGGTTSENWGLVKIDEVLDHTQYDIVIIEFYINDFNGGMALDIWKNNLKILCEKCIRKGARPVILMPTWTASAQQSYTLLKGHYYLLDGFKV